MIMAEEKKEYVFNEVEDVKQLAEDELRVYATEMQERLKEAQKQVKMYQGWWYEEQQKVETIKADVATIKKVLNLMQEKW